MHSHPYCYSYLCQKLNQIMPDIPTVERMINYHFNDPKLLDEALLAAGASTARKDVNGPLEGNKTLALVGDAALQLALLDSWYSRDASRGKILAQYWRLQLTFCRTRTSHRQ
jgi:hypothetical protein